MIAVVSRRAIAVVAIFILNGKIAAASAEESPVGTPTPGVVEVTPDLGNSDQPEITPTPRGVALEGTWRGAPHLSVSWDNGVNYRLSQPIYLGAGEAMFFDQEASLTGRIGVRFAVDTAGFVQHGQLPQIDDGVEIRRFFLTTRGEIRLVQPIYFRIDVGIVNGSFYLDENYLMLKNLPYIGSFMIGQFDAPMSLDLLTGSTARPFMEAAAPVAALAPGLKAGIQVANQAFDQHLTWAFGYFLDGQTPDVGDASQSYARLVGRITWLPQESASPGDALIHLGLSASYVLSSRAEIRYKSRPESYIAPTLADTGTLDTKNAFPLGAEFALTRGPLLAQAEYLVSFVTAADLDDPIFRGYYSLAAWMLTGEEHPYDRTDGTFSPVIPNQTLSPCDGHWGAWEVAGRYSYLDLSDGTVRGGQMRIVSAGLNWYWNSYMRWMFDYEHAFIDQSVNDGNLSIFQARFQLVF